MNTTSNSKNGARVGRRMAELKPSSNSHSRNGKRSVKQPPVLFAETQALVKRIQDELGATLITYWNNPGGSVCANDVVAIFEALQKIGKQKKICLFIKSNGGSGKASLRMVNLLRQHTDSLVALVPLECVSAATMLALGADEIQMGPMAYLSAVDTSLTHDLSPIDRDNDRVSVSLDELKRLIKLWRSTGEKSAMNPYQALFPHVHPLVIGAVDRADSLSIMLCKEILSYHIADEKKATRIARALNANYPSHTYPILMQEARRIGLKATLMKPEVNALLLRLNEVYSEMGQRAVTDFDDANQHNNEILNIIETTGLMIRYQVDKDWFYRTAERRWVALNDESAWMRHEQVGKKVVVSKLHVA